MAAQSTNWHKSLISSKTTPIHAASLSRRGTSPTSRTWLCHRVMRFSNFMSPMANYRASYTSAAPIFSLASHSTSPPTPCSRTCWHSNADWSPKNSSGRAATVTCTATTLNRCKPNWHANLCLYLSSGSNAYPTRFLTTN